MNLSDTEKKIYNFYLKNSRKGQPYQPRKDFDKMDANTSSYLIRIGQFLKRYNHINWNEYFEAFNVLHPNESYPSLNYFVSRNAIKNYALYQKQKEDRNPEKQFEDIKKSINFIGVFCLQNKIQLEDYLYHKTGYMYSWLNHYREHRINPYSIMELGNYLSILDRIPKDELYLFATNLHENLVAFKKRYIESPQTQSYVKKLTSAVKNFVKKELTK
jgi:hypothetical protein